MIPARASDTSVRKASIPPPSVNRPTVRPTTRKPITRAYSVAPWPSSRLSPVRSSPSLSEIRSNIPYLPLNSQRRLHPALLDTFHLGGRQRRLRTAKGWVEPPVRITFRWGEGRQWTRGRPRGPRAPRGPPRLPSARRVVVPDALPRPDGSRRAARRDGAPLPAHELRPHALHALPDRRRLPRRRVPGCRDPGRAAAVAVRRRAGGEHGARARRRREPAPRP